VEKDLIINSTPASVEIAMLEDGKLVELHKQRSNKKFSVGDIFLGKVRKLMPGLNAAFLDIGHRKDAFLHYTDMGPRLNSNLLFTKEVREGKYNLALLDRFKIQKDIVKTGKVSEVLSKAQPVLVQILKEPISTKGPRLTCEITIPGRFLVMSPFSNHISISKKIRNSDERKRLQTLLESIKPNNFGFIIRTVAEGKKVADLHEEILELQKVWENLRKQLVKQEEPGKLHSELDKTSTMLRDILNDDFNKVIVNEKDIQLSLKSYLESIAPEKKKMVQLHRGSRPIFDHYSVSKQIKSGFGKTYTMGSGAYLVIEHTEAMHVIDVNSGPKSPKDNQESQALSVNLEAAKEISRQLRLRDIGGLIIIDYIDMRNSEHRKELFNAMREYMKSDRAQHTILPLSKFGLMQITRERTKPVMKIDTSEECPTCQGRGKVNPTILISDLIQRDLAYIIQSRPKSKVQLNVHPYIDAFLKKGIPSLQHRWYFKFGKWVRIAPDMDLALQKYKFIADGNDEVILD
jgi:ribonuclease G